MDSDVLRSFAIDGERIRECNACQDLQQLHNFSRGIWRGEKKKGKQTKKCKESAKIRLSQYKAISFANESYSFKCSCMVEHEAALCFNLIQIRITTYKH